MIFKATLWVYKVSKRFLSYRSDENFVVNLQIFVSLLLIISLGHFTLLSLSALQGISFLGLAELFCLYNAPLVKEVQ